MSPACEVRVVLRAPDGRVHARSRLCWTDPPVAACVLGTLTCRARDARRRGLRLEVAAAPDEVLALLEVAGLREVLVGEHLR